MNEIELEYNIILMETKKKLEYMWEVLFLFENVVNILFFCVNFSKLLLKRTL